MDLHLKNKLVIVAGGSGLIGKAVVHGFLAEGSYVLNCDILNGDVYFDMAKPESIWNAVDFFGVPEIFVNASYPRDFFAHAFGFMEASRIVAEAMTRNLRGSIVNFSSIYGMVAPDFSLYPGTDVNEPPLHYAFEKAGIIQMTKWLAKKYGCFGVRINAISPGGVLDKQNPLFVSRYERRTPLGKMATVEDIVPVVLFLASDASRYVTGQNLVVDGGWVI